MKKHRPPMLDNTFLYLVMFVAFFITVAKLYYEMTLKIVLKDWKPRDLLSTFLPSSGSDVRAMCPVLGYRCADSDNCDCHKICGHDFEMYRAGDGGHEVVLNTQELVPGAVYCVPKSRLCNLRVARPIHTTDGWSCIARYPQIWSGTGKKIACSSPYAKNDELNFMVDTMTGTKVEQGDIDIYERKSDGTPRYQCECGSLDRGKKNRMVAIPQHYQFVCFVDHCLRDVYMAGIRGWDGTRCDCGHLGHLDPTDPTSPCVKTPTVLRNNRLVVHVPCVDEQRLDVMYGGELFYCPDTYAGKGVNDVHFEKKVVFDITRGSDALIYI